MQDIVDGVSELFSSGIILHLKKKIAAYLKECITSEKNIMYDIFNILENPFLNFKSEYQRLKYFESHNLFFKPKTIIIGYTPEKKKSFWHRSTDNGACPRTLISY